MDFMMKWLVFVSILLILITYLALSKSRKVKSNVKGRAEISEVIEERPVTTNPLLWVIGISYLFMGFTIVYYATSF